MSNFTQILFTIVIIIITIYIIISIIYSGNGSNYVLSKIQSLDVKKDILYPDQTQKILLSGGSSTVAGFFKLENGDRTLNITHGFVPLLQVENNWYLEISPAPVGKEKISARLRVQTNDGGTIKQELIDLPDIPKQKWNFIAILREGRRFDVIYNNQIVASQRLENYPVVISSPLSVGNKGLSGSVINVLVNANRLTPSEVEKERLAKVNTDNTVIDASILDMSFPTVSLFAKCPPGLPCDSITKSPHNNLLQWNTPYA